MDLLLVPLVIIASISALWMASRFLSRTHPRPCPTSLIWLLDNPFTTRYHIFILSRLDMAPGLTVLDAGCGPGLLTIPIARAVGPQGSVVGLDVQEGMIQRARAAAAQAAMSNITFLIAGLGEGKLPTASFDRALLVTVLGEIPDRPAALREIYSSLKPGGFLSITEVLPDPDYQPRPYVKRLALEAGFRLKSEFGNLFMFTLNLERPYGA
jgi:ubiquinone/menaquinone biosynthesis C-methylase UbiE